jgi:hypothetical protein
MKNICMLLILILLAMGSQAQDTIVAKSSKVLPTEPIKVSKFYWGGYLNLTFGSYTAIGVEPLIAYKITPKLSTGAIVSYEFIKDNRYSGYTYKESNYGASIFTRFRLIPQIYLHAEFSEMKYNTHQTNGYQTSYWVPFLLLGGGFSQQISENSWFNTQILFDVIQNEHSPYGSGVPFFSVGFGVGF